MLNLTSTSDLIQIITGSAVSTIGVQAAWADYNGTTVVPGRTNTNITTATTTTVVASPAASTQRALKSLIVFNSHASSSNKITIQHTDGTTVAILFVYTLLAGETIVYGESGQITVIDATGQIKTAPGNVLTSPVINGTPTGTGIPTVTIKKGSGVSSYSTTSTTFVDVDATNLAYTVTIPTGWKLVISASGDVFQLISATAMAFSLFDGSTLIEDVTNPPINASSNISLNWVITGDGASHTVKLQFRTFNAADSANLRNTSATNLPTMVFILLPSN